MTVNERQLLNKGLQTINELYCLALTLILYDNEFIQEKVQTM